MKNLLFTYLITALVIAVPASLVLPLDRLLVTTGFMLLVGAIAGGAILTGRERGGDDFMRGYAIAFFTKAAGLLTLAWIFHETNGRGARELLIAILLLFVFHLWTAHALARHQQR